MSKYHPFIFSLISFLIINACTEVDLPQKRIGAYLGETPPDTIAKLFAPGFVSTGFNTRDLAMAPDGNEIYFCVNIGSNSFMTTLFTRRINDEWTEPQVAPFARDLRYFTIEPCIAPNGQELFFASNHPDSLGKDHNSDIWYVKREGAGWGLPQNLGTTINTEAPEFFPSITKDGTLYFTRDDPKTGISYIYRSRFTQGTYTEPELLPEQINAGRSRFNAFIAPDESFILIPIFGMVDSYGSTDYYVSFHNKNDKWSEPINLGNKINSKSRWEYSASISPDNKYLFFTSSKIDTSLVINHDIITMHDLRELSSKPENGNPDIYWIEAAFIQELRPEGF